MIVWIPLKRANQERTDLDGIQRAAVVKKISSIFVPNSKFLKEPLLGGGNQFGLIPKIRKSLEKKWETAVKNPSATVYSKPQNLIDDNRLGYFFRLFFYREVNHIWNTPGVDWKICRECGESHRFLKIPRWNFWRGPLHGDDWGDVTNGASAKKTAAITAQLSHEIIKQCNRFLGMFWQHLRNSLTDFYEKNDMVFETLMWHFEQ